MQLRQSDGVKYGYQFWVYNVNGQPTLNDRSWWIFTIFTLKTQY